jgi:hypothetical protein
VFLRETLQGATMSDEAKTAEGDSERLDVQKFQTLTIRIEGAVLFAEISAPPMKLLGPE